MWKWLKNTLELAWRISRNPIVVASKTILGIVVILLIVGAVISLGYLYSHHTFKQFFVIVDTKNVDDILMCTQRGLAVTAVLGAILGIGHWAGNLVFIKFQTLTKNKKN